LVGGKNQDVKKEMLLNSSKYSIYRMVALNLKQRDVKVLQDNFNKKPDPPLATWDGIVFSQV
jgi:hypothetical protein